MGGWSFLNRSFLLAVAVCITGAAFASSAHAVSDYRIDHHELSTYAVSDQLVLVNNEGKMGSGAQDFVQSMANRAIGFLGNEGLSQAQKKNSFRKLLQDSFDMKTIGRFSLGRYWRFATPDQRNEYQKLFEKMVINVYSDRFSEYTGQKFETRSFREEGTKDTLVTSYIVPEQGPEIEVEWRVRYKKGRYKVVDVIVEGVSMSVTQRSDFSSVIQRGGGEVSALLTYLKSL